MILKQLHADASEPGDLNPLGLHSMVQAEPAPGVIVHIGLGPGGLVVRWGKESVGIHLADILSLAGLDPVSAAAIATQARTRSEVLAQAPPSPNELNQARLTELLNAAS